MCISLDSEKKKCKVKVKKEKVKSKQRVIWEMMTADPQRKGEVQCAYLGRVQCAYLGRVHLALSWMLAVFYCQPMAIFCKQTMAKRIYIYVMGRTGSVLEAYFMGSIWMHALKVYWKHVCVCACMYVHVITRTRSAGALWSPTSNQSRPFFT